VASVQVSMEGLVGTWEGGLVRAVDGVGRRGGGRVAGLCSCTCA
jgi:hypothetical protein